jgi:molybdenum cofactor cytidylyltransferase
MPQPSFWLTASSKLDLQMPSVQHIGVILAAGRGSRMGCTKQLVPWPAREGSKPLVSAAYDAIRPICDAVIVVLGHDAAAVAAALGDRPFHRAQSDPDAPMFESIRAGLAAARGIDPGATVVLQPADQPEVAPATRDALLAYSFLRREKAIIPEHRGRGGHPALIPAKVAEILIEAECPAGLGQFWTEHPGLCHRLAVDDASILLDVDTPDDLPA